MSQKLISTFSSKNLIRIRIVFTDNGIVLRIKKKSANLGNQFYQVELYKLYKLYRWAIYTLLLCFSHKEKNQHLIEAAKERELAA